jgi:hypothetical protein
MPHASASPEKKGETEALIGGEDTSNVLQSTAVIGKLGSTGMASRVILN